MENDERMISDIIDEQGWDDAAICRLLFEYIDNQGSMDALRDFFAQKATEENAP